MGVLTVGIFSHNREPDTTTQQILAMLEKQQVTVSSTPPTSSLLSAKNINALVIAAVIGAFAFLWTNATITPQKNAEQFSAIATQTAEIRTTVIQMKTDFATFSQGLTNVRSQVDTNRAEIDGLKKDVQTNADRITQLEKDTR